MTEEILLEIGTEEIPAAFMPDALAALKSLMEKELAARRIAFKEIETFGTPRRLALMASKVAQMQTDLMSEKLGPAKNIAFDTGRQAHQGGHWFCQRPGHRHQ